MWRFSTHSETEAPRRGELVFAVPYLAEYLIQNMQDSK